MSVAVELPEHAKLFHYNLTAAVTRGGFSSSVNLLNYYCDEMSQGAESESIADILFFDEDGREGFNVRRRLPPGASLHLDVGETLREAGHPSETIGTVYTRLIPLKVPAPLKDKQVSTECTGEIVTPTGARDFIHNLGGPVYRPNVTRVRCGLMVASQTTNPKYIVLVNNYLGRRLPLISAGFARLSLTNCHGEVRRTRTPSVPARGMRLFSLDQAFPDLFDFLDGKSGKLDFYCANLAGKSWIWFGPKDGWGDLSIEHM